MADRIYAFGSGDLILVPSGVNPTPQVVGDLQEVSVEFNFDTKELYGSRTFPIAIGRGKGKITGKAKSGQVNSALMSSIFSGSTSAPGYTAGIAKETTGTIAGATYTAANTTGFSDRGVLDENKKRMKCVASAPAVGEYSVSGVGVYTFNSGATGKVYTVAYMYTVAGSGQTISYANQLMGAAITYSLDLFNTAPDGSKYGLFLNAVVIPKFGLSMKNDEFGQPDIEFQAFADANDNVFKWFMP